MRSMHKLAGIFVLAAACSTFASAQKLKPDEVIAKHLDSIAPATLRSTTKTLILTGAGRQKFTSTSDAPAEGRMVIASEGAKMFLGMNMNSPQYPGQRWVFDGKRYDVALTTMSGRDFLGNFVQDNGHLLKSGIFGGTLSTGWLLANAPDEKGKLSYEGTKKIGDREVHILEFLPKGGSDISINFYFDAETFRHLRTEYKRMTSAPQGVMSADISGRRTGDNSARQTETRIGVTEDFSDFQTVQGVTVPKGYKISYSYSGNRGTVQCEWTFTLTDVAVNQKFDPSTFAIKDQGKSDD